MNLCFCLTHATQEPMAKLLISSFKRVYPEGFVNVYIKKPLSFVKSSQKINIHHFEVPKRVEFFPFYDKILAGSTCEGEQNTSFLWVDIDSVFFDFSPDDFQPPIQINPVDKKNIGLTSQEERSEFWLHILKEVGLKEESYKKKLVTTTISKEKIYPYFNIGMVYLDSNLRLFTKTLQTMDNLLANPDFRELLDKNSLYRIFLHQAVFSAFVVKEVPDTRLHTLPKGYNIPLHLLEEKQIKSIVKKPFSIRYDTFFHKHTWPSNLEKPIEVDESTLRMQWIYK